MQEKIDKKSTKNSRTSYEKIKKTDGEMILSSLNNVKNLGNILNKI